MPISKSVERLLRQILQDATTAAVVAFQQQQKSEPSIPGQPIDGDPQSRPGLDDGSRFWKMYDTPTTEDDEQVFWSRFTNIAGSHVEELSDNLNMQMDNLLLYATLFSAVNASFLVFSLPNLGSPAIETTLLTILIESQGNGTASQAARDALASQYSPANLNIAVKVLFALSLIFSLGTAFFVVLGKQWMNHLSVGEMDSNEKTGEELYHKISGARRYALSKLIDIFLTTTIQISLILFVIGLILFLTTFSIVITWFVTGFTTVGLLAYLCSTYLALRDPGCPFQTPVTTTILPKLLDYLFYTGYWVWVPVRSAIKSLGIAITAAAPARPGQESDKQRDYDEITQPQWDKLHMLWRQTADKLLFKQTHQQVNIKAACWMIQTAQNELATRTAALMLLGVTDREELSFVATYGDTVKRLRDVISVSDEVLKKEAKLIGHIKEHEWKKLCFYVQVLSHIFAGHLHVSIAQCKTMDRIYEYQRNRARRDNHEHVHTVVPSRMVGVIKLLLIHFDGKHDSTMKRGRRKILTHRLYQAPLEPQCSSKALSLAAFAMKTLPHVALKELVEQNQAEEVYLHNDLWHSYLENSLDVLRNNVVGAMITYAELRHSEGVQDILPSDEQLQRLLHCVMTRRHVKDCLSTANAQAEVVDAVAKLLQTLPVVQPGPAVTGRTPTLVLEPSLFQSAVELLQSERDRIFGLRDLSTWQADDRAILAEACFRLAGKCSDGLSSDGTSEENETVYKIVLDIWTTCYDDTLLCARQTTLMSLTETVGRLRAAAALLWAADPQLDSPALPSLEDEQRNQLDEVGLRWIREVAANLGDWELTRDLYFTSPEARGAISYFLQRLAEIDPKGSETELIFAEKYLSLCQERGLEEHTSIKRLGEVVAAWRVSFRSSD